MRKIIATLFLAGASAAVLADDQIITANPLSQDAAAGSAVSVGIDYNTVPVDETLTGLGLRVHFDSSKLTFNDAVYGPDGDGFSQPVSGPVADAADDDSDPTTDQFIILTWVDLGGNFPGVDPATLAAVNFTTAADFTGTTSVNFSASSTAAGFDLGPNSATINSGDGGGPDQPTAGQPTVVSGLQGMTVEDATAALEAAGFTTINIIKQFSDAAAPGTVLLEEQILTTSTVNLTIASDDPSDVGPVGPGPVGPGPVGPVQPIPSISSFGLLLLTPLLGLVAMFRRKK